MPPSSPPHEDLNPEGLPIPSEEDIQILYDIVRSAEEHEGINALQFRALFAAYNQILSERGIDTAHDRIYLRFLFRLGEIRRKGQSLEDAFEVLLARLGIVIQFSDDESEIGTIRTLDIATEDDSTKDPATHSPPRRTRRASFSSFISFEEESARITTRPSSRSSMSRLQEDHTQLAARTRSREKLSFSKDFQDYLQARRHALAKETVPVSNDNTPMRYRPEEQHKTYQHDSLPGRSREENRSDLIARAEQNTRLAHQTKPVDRAITSDDLVAAASSFIQSGSFSTPITQETDPTITLDIDYQQSLEEQSQDADTLQSFHQRDLARRVIWRWRHFAVQRRQYRLQLEWRASEFEQKNLAARVLGRWKSPGREKQYSLESEKFYAKLERKAARARDFYILSKAFTHWAQCTAEEQERCSVAKRHIMRFRYFNAWREISVVNEFKIRRFILAKFFELWKDKLAAIPVLNERAIVTYTTNLVETVYWRWFWSFFEQKAPEFYALRLKRKVLQSWLNATQDSRRRASQVEPYREQRLRHHTLALWMQKSRAEIRNSTQAMELRRQRFLAQVLPIWQLSSKLSPIAKQVGGKKDQRIVSTAFSRMTLIMEHENQASRLNRHRLLRSAWTLWNDRLRCQMLRSQINDRVLVQALYRWVLEERCKLLTRLNQERLQEKFWNLLRQRMAEKQANLLKIGKVIAETRNRRLRAMVLESWKTSIQVKIKQSQQADETRTAHVLRKNMESWHRSYNHCIEMRRWSNEASFYIRASRSLKTWQAAVVDSRKTKLKTAYSQIRRRVKMNLAKKLLHIWHAKTLQILRFQDDATRFSNEHMRERTSGILQHWQDRTIYVQSLLPVAIDQHQYSLILSSVQTWHNLYERTNVYSVQCNSFAASHVESKAYEILRKLRLRALEIRSLESKASTAHLWKEQRRKRAILLYWNDRAIQNRSPSVPSPLPTAKVSRSARARRFRGTGGSVSEDSARTLVPDDLQQQYGVDASRSTTRLTSPVQQEFRMVPVPSANYLSTPSKRAARARAIFAGSYTPAIAADTPQVRVTEAGTGDNDSAEPQDKAKPLETPLVRRLFQRGDRSTRGPFTEARSRHERTDEMELGRSLGARGPAASPTKRSIFDRK